MRFVTITTAVLLVLFLVSFSFTANSIQKKTNVTPTQEIQDKELYDKLGPRVRQAIALYQKGASLSYLRSNGYCIDQYGHLDVFIRGNINKRDLEALGVTVRTQLPGICTATVPRSVMESLLRKNFVHSVLGAAKMKEATVTSVPATGISSHRSSGPVFEGLNGEGVLLGIVDRGYAVDHLDFRNADGSPRVVQFWDQTNSSGPSPNDPLFGYGTEYLSEQIQAELVPANDFSSHGSTVLGVAGGNGSGTGFDVPAFTYVGMAPKADLAVVKTDYMSTRVIDAVAYLFQLGEDLGMPTVVNLSLGYTLGPHDGTSPLEQAIDLLTGPQKIVTTITQNYRQYPFHAEAFAQSDSNFITMNLESMTPGQRLQIDGYYNGTEQLSMSVLTPDGDTLGPISLAEENMSYPGEATSNGLVYIYHGIDYSPVNPELFIEIQEVPGTEVEGEWTFIFNPINTTANLGEVDMWMFPLPLDEVSVGFEIGSDQYEERVSEPGNAHSVITVGAYNTTNIWETCFGSGSIFPHGPLEGLSDFSNPGPTRDGRQKPDITAPGAWIGTTLAPESGAICDTDLFPGAFQLLPDSLQHVMTFGTSVAAPHVSGLIAIFLQENAEMTPLDIQQRLIDCAITDEFTGGTPNFDWGYGKLFYCAPVQVDENIATTEKRPFLFPNPTEGSFFIRTGNELNQELSYEVALYSLSGKLMYQQQHAVTDGVIEIIPKKLPAGVYQVLLHNSKITYQASLLVIF